MTTVFAAAVNERRVARLSDYPRSVTAALWTRRRFRWNAGRLLRSFVTRAEDVFARIAAMVDDWHSTERSRSVIAAFRAEVWGWWSRHERLRSQDSFLF